MSLGQNSARTFRFWGQRVGDVTDSWKEMVRLPTVPADVAAGLSVACVALPLNIALATAAGLPAGVGLVAGVVAGIIGGLFSGSRFQVTGPEAALLPTVAGIVAVHGAAGLAVATLIAGAIQIALGLLRVGRLARLIPRAVVIGFTAGIGLLLLNTQLPRLFGVEATHVDAVALVRRLDWIPQVGWLGVGAGVLTMAAMIFLPRIHPRIPGVLIGLVLATTGMIVFGHHHYDAVGELPRSLPHPSLPDLSQVNLAALLPSALALAFLASLGSLLATSSLDGLRNNGGPPSDLDQDLIAQGMANLAAGFFAGFPVMGAIVRASASIQAGARTRAAAISHALWLLIAMMLFAPLVAQIPVAALTAILLVVGGRLLGLGGLITMWKNAKSTVAVVIVTAAVITAYNFTVGIFAGLALASVLYLRRHGSLRLEVQRVQNASELQRGLHLQRTESLPVGDGADLTVARVGGPLLFVNHMKLYDLLDGPPWPKLVTIDLARCPYVDSAGVATLKYLADFLAIRKSSLALVGVPGHLREVLEPVGPKLLEGKLHADLEEALLGAGLLQPVVEGAVVREEAAAGR